MHIFTVSYFFPNAIEEIDQFSGKDFEEFLFHFFTVIGLDPRITNDSDDKGVDLMIKRTPESEMRVVGIQAKRWKSSVGPDEIRKMLDGKSHYNLEELWMITTSKLTSNAQSTALNNHIKILTREHVIEFLKELKKRNNISFRPSKNKPTLKLEKEVKKFDAENILVTNLKKLRVELAKTHKLYPIYLVYNNNTIEEILKVLPSTIDRLTTIGGIGQKKTDLFGKEMLQVINEYKDKFLSPELFDKVKAIRSRIMKYNKIVNEIDVFTDVAISSILTQRPKTVEELSKIDGIGLDKINIFGEYLVNRIVEL